MNILSRTTAVAATLAAALSFNVPGAHAAAAGWTIAGGASVTDSTHVVLDPPDDGGTASLFNDSLSIHVEAPAWVSFNMHTLDNTWCVGSDLQNVYPKVSVTVGTAQPPRVFSNKDDEYPCPEDGKDYNTPGSKDTQDDGEVNFRIGETGTITAIHLEYKDIDSEPAHGVAEIRDLTINGEPVKWAEDPPVQQPCQGSDCPHVATAYGATLSKNYSRCRVRVYDFLDAALKDQYADPQSRTFVTRVDGRVRANEVLQAGQEDRTSFHVKANSGKRTVTVKTDDGQLLDRMKFRSGRC